MVRQRKLDAEDSQVRRETGLYLEQVSKARGNKAMQERRKAKGDEMVQNEISTARKIKQRTPIDGKFDA